MRLFIHILLAGIFLWGGAAAHDDPARAHYLGNEGVMIVHEDTKILFDAFYANSYGQYALVPDEIAGAMMTATPPYDGIDAIFVSHVHGDHFTAAPAITYLRAHETVHLYGSQQVYDAILAAGVAADEPLMARVHGFDLDPEDEAKSFKVGALSVDVVAIPHAGNRPTIQNFAWRVTLDDEVTVMHLGDADPEPADFTRHQAHFDAKKTHTAFPPDWFIGLERGEMILKEIIGANQVVGIHVPKRAGGNGDQWRARAGGDLFTDPGETREVSGQ